MNFEPHSDWKCSPERINNALGYTDDNVRFICLEFQCSHVQASRELVDLLCRIETQPHPRLTEIMSGKFIEVDWVPHCQLGQLNCAKCKTTYNKYYLNTLNGKLRVLSSNAKGHITLLNERGREHGPSENDYEDNLKMLQNQQGKCYLTGHHLGFKSWTWNCISLERIDVKVTYNTIGNCCLIMQCLNTSNCSARTSLANLPKDGSGGWTRDKINKLREFKASQSTTRIHT